MVGSPLHLRDGGADGSGGAKTILDGAVLVSRAGHLLGSIQVADVLRCGHRGRRTRRLRPFESAFGGLYTRIVRDGLHPKFSTAIAANVVQPLFCTVYPREINTSRAFECCRVTDKFQDQLDSDVLTSTPV